MGPQPAEFVCVCSQKILILGDREKALREQAEKLKQSVRAAGLSGESLELQGGCIFARNASLAEAAGVGAAFIGQIENRKLLLDKHVEENVSENSEKAALSLRSDAELVCTLYKIYGRALPQKLKGRFSFVLFDPTQGRVLAAVSPMSRLHLLQARSPDNSLIITTRAADELPSGSQAIIPIAAGFLKYGWSSDPQRYVSSKDLQLESKETAFAATKRALRGIETSADSATSSATVVQASGNSFGGSESGGEPQSPAPKKTRRGKRAGRNQKQRAEQMLLQRLSSETPRQSLDYMQVGSLQSVSSLSSRADEHNWWRTNTPRNSLDVRHSANRFPERTSMESRRLSMSPSAPPFVPATFSRQSVPALKTQSSALTFGAVPDCFGSSRTVLGQQQLQLRALDEPSPTSPFEDAAKPEQPKVGKADAAWGEGPAGAPQPPITAEKKSSADTDSTGPEESAESVPETGQLPHAKGSKTSATAKQHKQPSRARPGSKSPQSGTSKGGSPEGGSPHRPPRAPNRGPLRDLFKAMLSGRSSSSSLRMEASSRLPAPSRARSSSHGNLVELEHPTGLWDAPQAVPTCEKQKSQLPNLPPPRNGSYGDVHTLAFQKLQVSGDPAQRNAASWLAKKTRSIFGKSKSCTNIAEMEKPAQLHSPTVSDVEVA